MLSVRAGFNHHTEIYQKMPLKKSWRIVDGQKVDKNLYSAFLLSNLAEDMQSSDLEKCAENFPMFLEEQSEQMQSLDHKGEIRQKKKFIFIKAYIIILVRFQGILGINIDPVLRQVNIRNG